VARKTFAALVRTLALAVVALVLASCGGGSTAGPVAGSSVATTTAAPPPAQPQPSAAPATTATTPAAPVRTAATAPAPRPQPAARPRARSRSSRSAAPSPARHDGSLADAPAAAGEATTPAPAQPVATPLDERAKLVLTRRITPAHYFQQGTVTGTYDGTMDVEARITTKGVLVRFTATLPGGTISGRGLAVAILDSTSWPGLRGSAIVTGGTGRFANIRGRRLSVTGRAKPDASRAHVRLAGTVSGI
jgi:hypothetical protein